MADIGIEMNLPIVVKIDNLGALFMLQKKRAQLRLRQPSKMPGQQKTVKLSKQSKPLCNQSLPSSLSWSTWKKVIQQITISNRRKLQHQLGDWIIDYDQIRASFKYYRTEDRIFNQSENKLNEYPIMGESIVKSDWKQCTYALYLLQALYT
jgi:hypothetical protein